MHKFSSAMNTAATPLLAKILQALVEVVFLVVAEAVEVVGAGSFQ